MSLGSPSMSVAYGSRTFDATTTGKPVGNWLQQETREQGTFKVQILVVAATTNALNTYCAAIRADLRLRNKALTVTMNGETFISWDPAARTGLAPVVTWEKVADGVSGPCSRLYDLTFVYLFSLASENEDFPGQEYASVRLLYSGSRRKTVEIEGRVTGYAAATDAWTAYAAGADTFCTAILDAIATATDFELSNEDADYDDNIGEPDVLTYHRTYTEILTGQAEDPLDLADIRNAQLSISKTEGYTVGLGPTGEAAHAGARVRCTLSCDVLETQTDLRAYYLGTIRPLLLARMALAAGATVYKESEEVTVSPDNSALSVTIEGFAPGGDILDATLSVTLLAGSGCLAIPRASGKDHDYTHVRVEAKMRRQVQATFTLPYPAAQVSDLWAKGGITKAAALAADWLSPPYGDPAILVAQKPVGSEEIRGACWVQHYGQETSVTVQEISRDGTKWCVVAVSGEQTLDNSDGGDGTGTVGGDVAP